MDINLKLENYDQEGLYLLFPDGNCLTLTRKAIEEKAMVFWQDETKISKQVKDAAQFARCDFCPLKGCDSLCDAIRPTFSLIESLDKYFSHNEIVAVYKTASGGLYTRQTTMQNALRELSLLSLVGYCRIGRKYWRHFLGIIPLADASEIAATLYFNFYYLCGGNQDATQTAIDKFKKEITVTARNQVQRLNLICQKDAFLNAFVNAQVITEILSYDFDKTIKEAFGLRYRSLAADDSGRAAIGLFEPLDKPA
ncbi:MAG: hypothetical protein A2Y12_16570 [Planctomycetes bacterium GWF2_42_9]|nr:MAG: hypothetical protein A2Y12_16570 [Planctomycetes bacterium GWF2_42_9]